MPDFQGLLRQQQRRSSGTSRVDPCPLRVKGAGRIRLVHLLIAETFLGPKPDGHQVHHRDGTLPTTPPRTWSTSPHRRTSDPPWLCGESGGPRALATGRPGSTRSR
ncbi:HNH endonuclease [Streptomyces sp. NPDC057494]|uniref:HNH endonuclease n=1 Tax=Streptomyces sp. NPDC057494 TaxID=3346148 RepID=UPI0036BE952E